MAGRDPRGAHGLAGDRPIRFEADHRYLVVIAAVRDGWCAVYDTVSDVLTPFDLRAGRFLLSRPASPGIVRIHSTAADSVSPSRNALGAGRLGGEAAVVGPRGLVDNRATQPLGGELQRQMSRRPR